MENENLKTSEELTAEFEVFTAEKFQNVSFVKMLMTAVAGSMIWILTAAMVSILMV